jgi:F-type H+-transporting ATPase subunit epsilon
MASLHLEVITPEGTLLSLEAEAVALPTAHRGEYGLLPGHTPLVVTLGRGLVRLRQGGVWHWVAVWGGVAEVQQDQVIVLARRSEAGKDLDPSAVEAEIQHAQRLIDEARTEPDLDRAVAALEWALLRGELLKSPGIPTRQLLGEPNMPGDVD